MDKIDSGPAAAGGWAITHCQAAGDETPSGHSSADPRGGGSGWLAGSASVLKPPGLRCWGTQDWDSALPAPPDRQIAGGWAHVHSMGEAGRDSVFIITDPVSQAGA